MKKLKDIREDSTRDPRGMSIQSLSRIANTPGHPMHANAKNELARRQMQQEGGMKRIATTQSNKTDRMAAGGNKGLETFKKKPTTEASAKKLSNYIAKASDKAGRSGVDTATKDKLIGGIKKADDKLRKMDGKGSAAKVAATEDVNEAATPAMKKAADELNSYAKKSGGIDKADFMKTAKMLSTGKAGMALIKWVNGQDTDVYEKILTVMAKHMGKQTIEKMFKVRVREKVQVDELSNKTLTRFAMSADNDVQKRRSNRPAGKGDESDPKIGKRLDKINLAHKKGAFKKEDVNEISKKTAQSYLDKTKGDDAWSGTRKANNRLKGAIQAVGKLRKDEAVNEPQGQAKRMMSPLQKMRMDKEKADRDRDGKLKRIMSPLQKRRKVKSEQSADKLYNYWNKAYDDVSDPDGKDPSKLKKRRSFMKKAAAQHNVKMGWKKPTGVKKDASGASKSAAALAKHLAKKDMQQ